MKQERIYAGSDLHAAGFKLPLRDRTSRLSGKYKSSGVGRQLLFSFASSWFLGFLVSWFGLVLFVCAASFFVVVIFLSWPFFFRFLGDNIVGSISSVSGLLISVKFASGRWEFYFFSAADAKFSGFNLAGYDDVIGSAGPILLA